MVQKAVGGGAPRVDATEPAVADEYRSMEHFWRAIQGHAEGRSFGSVWDTYEAGERRQLEAVLAEGFGAPDAVVVSSGMGAITASLLALSLESGCRVEGGCHSGYFESTDLIDGALRPLGAVGPGPGVRLVEPISNEPSLRQNIRALSADVPAMVIDNSMFSWSVPYETWSHLATAPLCVVESIPKYLCRTVSGGVAYGARHVIEPIRTLARRMGLLLSRQSCIAILSQDFSTVTQRLRAHADNAECFARHIAERSPELAVRLPHRVARGAGLPSACASLVFVIYPEDQACLQEFESWAAYVLSEFHRPFVRAGYGWPVTYARAYGDDALNTPAKREYVRISVGLEPGPELARLAAGLRSSQTVIGDRS